MNILLGVSGGIAAYKTPQLVRLLTAAGHSVRVCLSSNAHVFVAPASLQALSGHRVYQHQFPPVDVDGMEHIHLARWADCLLIAPASASTIARLTCGMADELLATIALACKGPKMLAPAMNQAMWANPAVKANCELLAKRGWQVLPVDNGEQACGEVGDGRMLQPEALVDAIAGIHPTASAETRAWWRDKQVLITAGPTHEPIDPVRFIGNRSSGKMGYALAAAAAQLGAQVTLISGPTSLPDPQGVAITRISSAEQMHLAVQDHGDFDLCIGAAAVSDYTPVNRSEHKLHKDGERMHLTLKKTPDIIAALAAARRPGQRMIGFCAETLDTPALLERAREKLHSKQLDLVVANQVGDGLVFDQDHAALWLVQPKSERELPAAPKDVQALQILAAVSDLPNHLPDQGVPIKK